MDEKEKSLVDFLGKIPDRLIFAEAGRRAIKRRSPETKTVRGSKVWKQCRFCDAILGVREMREHVKTAHPGGAFVHPVIVRGNQKITACPLCKGLFNAFDMRVHLSKKHRHGV